MITRRCYQRTFRLRPCAETNRIFLFCIAHAAKVTGVAIHAVCVMSNHHHLVVTDERGVLPDFLRELHRLAAKAMNASQGQWENLWAAEQCNAVRLVTDDDIDDRIAYVVANPVAAGLVKWPDHWPGVLAWGERRLRVERPASYFDDDGVCPAEQVLTVERPRCRAATPPSTRAWLERVAEIIREKVAAAHRVMKEAGRVFLGRAAVLVASFIQRARSYEQRFGVIPTFAARDRVVRQRLRKIERGFRLMYRAALDEWRKGNRRVVFPAGTWMMAALHGAAVDSPPSS